MGAVAMGTLLKSAWFIYCLSLTAHDSINPTGNNHENLSKTCNKFFLFFSFAINDMKLFFSILHERKKIQADMKFCLSWIINLVMILFLEFVMIRIPRQVHNGKFFNISPLVHTSV